MKPGFLKPGQLNLEKARDRTTRVPHHCNIDFNPFNPRRVSEVVTDVLVQ
jgi:hypothetical protein